MKKIEKIKISKKMKNTFPDIILKNIMSKLQPPTTVINPSIQMKWDI